MFVVCTDRGQHGRIVLTRIKADRAVLTLDRVETHRRVTVPNQANAPGADSRESYRFLCRKCGRDVRIDKRRLAAGVELASQRRLSDVDISLID